MSLEQTGMAKGTARPDLLGLHEQLVNLFRERQSPQDILPGFLHLALGLVNGSAASFESINETGLATEKNLISRQAASWSMDIAGHLFEGSTKAYREGRVAVSEVKEYPALKIISLPVWFDGTIRNVLSVALVVDRQAPEIFILVLQFMVSCFSLWREGGVKAGGGESETVIPSSSTLLADIARILSEDGRQNGDSRLSQAVKELFGADFVILAPSSGSRDLAYSSMTGVASGTEAMRLAARVLDEAGRIDTHLTYPDSLGPIDYVASPILAEFCEKMRYSGAYCLNVPDGNGERAGAFLICWSEIPVTPLVMCLEEFTCYQGLIGALVRRNSPEAGRLLSAAWIRGWKRTALIGLGITSLIALFLFPVTFTIKGECVIEPKHIRYVTAPYDGTLKEVLVEPGDTVDEGDELARLDEREIVLQLNSLSAEIARTGKLRAANIASGLTAQAQMAALEQHGFEEQHKLLSDRLEKLALEAPITGTVISGSLEQHQGSPVRRGQQLFEIAPFAEMVAEARILQEDIGLVKEQAGVTVSLDSFPGTRFSSHLSLIYPRSELREGANVFLVEADLDNRGELRPGMRGEMLIEAGKKPLLYTLFRRPWLYLQQVLHSP